MKFLVKFFIFLFFPAQLLAQGIDPFQYSVDLSPRRLMPGDQTKIEVTLLIPPDHYLYKDKARVTLKEGDGFELGPIQTSKAMTKKDPFSGQDEDIFEEVATLTTTLKANPGISEGSRMVKLELNYQGCSDKLCFRLMRKELSLPVTIGPEGGKDENSIWNKLQGDPLSALERKGFWFVLLAMFLAGLGSAFTPCVLPIIPITLAFIGIRKQESGLLKHFFLSLLLTLSMSLTYAAMGVAVALLGKSLGFLFQSPYFLLFGVLLFVTFSLSLFGLFEIQVPMSWRNTMAKMGGAGPLGSILAGFTVGFLAAPCVGPIVGAILLYVAKERDAVHGFTLLFVYGLGMGSLFLLIGTFYQKLAAKVHGGPFTVWIKRGFAVLLLIPALYYGWVAVSQIRGPVVRETHNTFWIRSVDEGFRKAVETGKPIFMDFFASWCLPCVEMEKGTFSEPGFQKFLTENFIPVKVDCTQETPDCKAMVERYGVVGWPTFLILTPEGKVTASMIGESLSPEELKKKLSR